MSQGILTDKTMKVWGKFPRENYNVKIYSLGASNEGHGSALPVNIDDYMGQECALRVCKQTGCDYVGHFPYSGDRAGEMARDWNPGYMEKNEMIEHIVDDVKRDQRKYPSFSHVVIISGHGGNNFLETEPLADSIGVPTLYIPPFPGAKATHPIYGEIVISHADHGEHSIAKYLGVLNEEKLREINKVAAKDPIRAIRENPPIMGLGYYVLPQLSGDKYKELRERHQDLVDSANKFVNEDKMIIADYDVGRQLFEGFVEEAKNRVVKFSGIKI